MSDAPFNLAETDKLLSTTRAVRKRLDLDRPVERETILDCIRLSQQAPTGSNTQGWRWIIVTDPEIKKGLADIYNVGRDYIDQAKKNLEGQDEQTHRVYDSALWLFENLDKVPVHVIPCIHALTNAKGERDMSAGAYASIYPAVWSFQLALRSRGLGSTLTTLHLLAEDKAAKLLGIPDNVAQVALLPVGYTKGTDFKIADRPGPETITYWNGWKKS